MKSFIFRLLLCALCISLFACGEEPLCPNGALDPGEACDDGNNIDDDGCNSACGLPSCGNGLLDQDEPCDDGNAIPGDGCNALCVVEFCGDNIVNDNPEPNNPNEGCDDANNTPGDGCNLCVEEFCGDGIPNNNGEECDDGNQNNGDGCDNNCTSTGCGNNIQTTGESCDDGDLSDGDGCDSNCTVTACGNEIRTGLEECDDGNQTNGDGCDSSCQSENCGDGILQPSEECEDGNSTNGDGCDQGCNIEPGHFFESEPNDQPVIANGPLLAGVIIHGGINVVADQDIFSFTIDTVSDLKAETFDAGVNLATCIATDTALRFFAPDGVTQLAFNDNGGISPCSKLDPVTDAPMRRLNPGTYFFQVEEQGNNQVINKYQLRITITSACGDNSVGPFEQCDDGNTDSGDGCDSVCVDEFCGDVIINDSTEQCDDGNQSNTDACVACQDAFCGDTFIQTNIEVCDDGNTTSGDGCDANCTPSGCGNGILLPGELCFLSLQQIFGSSLSLAVGRFNLDAFDDIAVTDASTNVSFFLGNGAGGFSSAGSRVVGIAPAAVKVGRFNADALDDLVVVNNSSDSVSILLGSAAGNFSGATNFAVNDTPISVAVGRFNADAIDDIVVVHDLSDDILLMLSDGAGGFTSQTVLATIDAFEAAASDFNNDGAQDLLIVAGSSSKIFFGNGNGTFQTPVSLSFPPGTIPASVSLGHFNGDAFEDLAFSNGGAQENSVTVLLGNANGSFGAPITLDAKASNNFPRSILVGRFDNDPFDDIAVVRAAGGVGGFGINILRGDGSAGFSPLTTISVGTQIRVLAKGNFDADKIDDIAIANPANSANVGGIILAEGTTCGNGFLESPLEPCDDGNTVSGDGCSSTCQPEANATIFFSEYIEGASGTNKAVEIANPLNTAFDMAANACSVRLYTNGAAAPSQTVNLTGSIAPGDVFVLCNSLGNAAILAACDLQNNSVMNFNGDDSVELFCNGATLDFIGQKGVDPGIEFGVQPNSTLDQTLRRRCGITDGDTDFTDAFNPAIEWTSLGSNVFSDLGVSSCSP